jgi:hypothetical protein
MRGVYRATYPVRELGIEAGDTVIVEPGHERAPLRIVRSYTPEELPVALQAINDFPCLHLDRPSPTPRHQVPGRRRGHWLWLLS